MSWREQFNVHPAADVFPMMSDEELAALGEDIKKNGQQVPILTWDGGDGPVIVDGRNRLEAMERVGLTASPFFQVSVKDPVAFIIGANIHRRHLTKQQQLDLIVAARLAVRKPGHDGPVYNGGRGKVNPVKAAVITDAKAAGLDASERTVKRAIAKAEGKTPKPKAEPEPEPKPDGYRAFFRDDFKMKWWDLRPTRAEAVADLEAMFAEGRRMSHGFYCVATEERFQAISNPEGSWCSVGPTQDEIFRVYTGPTDDTSPWQRLAKVLVMLGSHQGGERQSAADAANKILQPMGWQLVPTAKRASTLPQDGRNGTGLDHSTSAK
jgi:hypothetical protein